MSTIQQINESGKKSNLCKFLPIIVGVFFISSCQTEKNCEKPETKDESKTVTLL